MSIEAFRRLEREGWERAAPHYVPAWGTLTRLFTGALLDAAGILPGDRLLDVACGPGGVAAEASRRDARAIGADFSREMLRAARAGHPHVAFVRADAERLPFASGAFDALVMSFGILHLADPDRALTEARRLLRAGGRFVMTVWARPEENPGMRIVSDAVERHADPSIRIPEGPDRHRFSDAGECRRALRNAGFSAGSVEIGPVRREWTLASSDALFDAEMNAGVRTAALLALQPPDRLERIREAIEAGVRAHRGPEGFAIPMTALVVRAAVR